MNHVSVTACLDSSQECCFLSIYSGYLVIVADTSSEKIIRKGKSHSVSVVLRHAEQACFLCSEFIKKLISDSISEFQACGYL